MIKSTLRQVTKSAAVRLGALSAYHRIKHRDTLTVLMFHRVLPDELIDAAAADINYTISTSVFAELLAKLVDHYNIVSMDDVIASRRREQPLPNRALLITFDDGWSDNHVFAEPLLRAAAIPWTLFVASDAISPPDEWWQETLLCALRSGRSTIESLQSQARSNGANQQPRGSGDRALDLILLYASLPEERRKEILRRFEMTAADSFPRPQTLSIETLREMFHTGVTIGLHGSSHLPLTSLDDPASDIEKARARIGDALGNLAVQTMSFPHGRYDKQTLTAARAARLSLLFTSDPVINDCRSGWIESDLLGRIPVATPYVSNGLGAISAVRWMPWLFLRSQTSLA